MYVYVYNHSFMNLNQIFNSKITKENTRVTLNYFWKRWSELSDLEFLNFRRQEKFILIFIQPQPELGSHRLSDGQSALHSLYTWIYLYEFQIRLVNGLVRPDFPVRTGTIVSVDPCQWFSRKLSILNLKFRFEMHDRKF